MRHVKLWSRLLALTLLLALPGCANNGANADTSPPAAQGSDTQDGGEELFTLRMITITSFNELNVADALGFFRDEGIQIEYIGTLSKGVTEHQLLTQGEVDVFVQSHPPVVAQARLAGMRSIAVTTGIVDHEEYTHVRYLVQKDSPIQSLDEAVGHKVAITRINPCEDGYVKYYVQSRGLDPEGVEFVTLEAGTLEQTLMQGLVDITTSHPPYAGAALATGEVREIFNTWEMFGSPGAGLSTRGFREDFIQEHPEVVQGFVNALYRARVWINNNIDESKAIVADFLDLDPSDLSSFYFDENKNIDPAYIEKWFEISETIGLWSPGDILPTDIYTNDFVPADIPAGDAALHWEGA
ncbi:MAG: ABC transporter substrate-binding protein [Oscillospiraceae bacterium]|jgi:ABC-type nitrate/sulfonate/bicarbonate transport system substrate-binding protein|nr:ABC transporter substrate-binding protein [Oscillospiraceae bacterium]